MTATLAPGPGPAAPTRRRFAACALRCDPLVAEGRYFSRSLYFGFDRAITFASVCFAS